MNPLLGSFNTGDLKRQQLPPVGQLAMGPPGRVLSWPSWHCTSLCFLLVWKDSKSPRRAEASSWCYLGMALDIMMLVYFFPPLIYFASALEGRKDMKGQGFIIRKTFSSLCDNTWKENKRHRLRGRQSALLLTLNPFPCPGKIVVCISFQAFILGVFPLCSPLWFFSLCCL